jgi:hypothetical protein
LEECEVPLAGLKCIAIGKAEPAKGKDPQSCYRIPLVVLAMQQSRHSKSCRVFGDAIFAGDEEKGSVQAGGIYPSLISPVTRGIGEERTF